MTLCSDIYDYVPLGDILYSMLSVFFWKKTCVLCVWTLIDNKDSNIKKSYDPNSKLWEKNDSSSWISPLPYSFTCEHIDLSRDKK